MNKFFRLSLNPCKRISLRSPLASSFLIHQHCSAFSSTQSNYIEKATEYLNRFSNDFDTMTGDDLKSYYSDNVKQIEFPNVFAPEGRTRDLQAMVDGLELGKTLLSSQEYRIKSMEMFGKDTVCAEIEWIGELAVDIKDKWVKGYQMRADIAMFIKYDQDDKIVEQREYSCYYP